MAYVMMGLGATAAGYPKRGDKGPAVETLQKALSAAGFTVAVDGDFGAKTQEALAAFQFSRGLPSTGVIDEVTGLTLWAPVNAGIPLLPIGIGLGVVGLAFWWKRRRK